MNALVPYPRSHGHACLPLGQQEPNRRITAAESLAHPWVVANAPVRRAVTRRSVSGSLESLVKDAGPQEPVDWLAEEGPINPSLGPPHFSSPHGLQPRLPGGVPSAGGEASQMLQVRKAQLRAAVPNPPV